MMDLSTIVQSGGDLFGLLIDCGLLIGFAMLWFSWYRNGKRQQQLERLLVETAGQLDAATRHLEETSRLIEHLKTEKVSRDPAPKPRSTETPDPEPVVAPVRNSTQATMILRMKREGDSAEAIADRLDLPLAQVKLLLKLHAPAEES